ncbi:hypothetical protein KP509_30G041200 [Ceratopteris richardii]|uniref:Transmembrane protein n=1 Tax=Ceratopteris richardii TaxID=49495 RepID=A0A8T2R450_CERRI|nr:hypothetical protein KP509_1Z299300 [Ceratopteris richardii]KAH7290293.1 hypothetical protein KP509_30G041200 [Ceratopteris richardii]
MYIYICIYNLPYLTLIQLHKYHYIYIAQEMNAFLFFINYIYSFLFMYLFFNVMSTFSYILLQFYLIFISNNYFILYLCLFCLLKFAFVKNLMSNFILFLVQEFINA